MSAVDTLKAYEQRINQHDFDALVELVAPHATFWFSDGSHHGHTEIRRAFEQTWRALADETYWLDQLEWIAQGEAAAACTYRFNWRAMIEGQPASGSGRGTSVLAVTNSGWQIVHEHLSARPPLAPAG